MDANSFSPQQESFSLSHLGTILMVALLLFGMAWMKNPALFHFKSSSVASENSDGPKYYAYTPSAEDSQGLVAGASTDPAPQGPVVINEDGTVSPVDMGEVLGASTKDVNLSLDSVAIKEIANSNEAVQNYVSAIKNIETAPIDSDAFESALSSGNQGQIDSQAQKLSAIKDQLVALSVPHWLAQYHKLKILQYSAAVEILKNFTQADNNPELVGQDLQIFLKTQQDLDSETKSLSENYNLDLNN